MSNIELYDYFLTDNKSGWKCVPSKLNNKNPELYNSILRFIEGSNIPDNIKFKQKVWHFINNEKDLIECHECGEVSRFLDIKRGYQTYCSKKCSNKNLDKISKTKENNMIKWGVKTPFENPEIYLNYKNNLKDKYGVDNVGQLSDVKSKIVKTNVARYGYETQFSSKEHRSKWDEKTSKIESLVCVSLGFTPKLVIHNKEYDMYSGSTIIEVDGDYHHPTTLTNLSLTQLSSSINDKEKDDIAELNGFDLVRIKSSLLKKTDITLDYIINNQYKKDYSLNYGDVIISKEYLKNYINVYGKDKLRSYVTLLLKFIRTFQPKFPVINSNENLPTIIDGISKFRFNNNNANKFNNNTSNIGVSYLKSLFKNYWDCSYKGNKSPTELWGDDEFMKKIISYRIGLNDSNEVFDFSIKNIIKGFSANRKTISFFKPVLAANIYQHYLTGVDNPTVFDPCSGFGGRLLGFKSVYPNGKYIGVDPDINTYGTLMDLSKNFNNCEIYNTKLEDFNLKINYDIAFTSIPYFDLESYSDEVYYKNYKEWCETFIKKLLTYPRLLVNMSLSLCEELKLTDNIDGYIESNTSHFDKLHNKKYEVIVKLNF